MATVDTRCTQCGNMNTNKVRQDDLNNGSGRRHGTEVILCSECSGTCDLDECRLGDPCDNCYTETVQNRCGTSVPLAQN